MKQENIPILIVVAVITALVVGGAMYWWQQSVLEKFKNEAQEQNNELQRQINELTKEPESYVKIISPNGGETLCLDEDFIVQWESKEVDSISLSLVADGRVWYSLGGFPATHNETEESDKGAYTWRVGETKQGKGVFGEGHAYKIEIKSSYVGSPVTDMSDSVFSIIRCEG